MKEKINDKESWQREISTLKEGIAYVYETKEFSDVKFQVKGEWIKAHKLVLAAGSTEFDKLFIPLNDLDELIVDEDIITKDGFEVLLRFIYTEKLGTTDKLKIIEGYLSALHYKHEALQNKCEEVMESWIITVDGVCKLFEVGIHVPVLRNKCIQFIKNNGVAVIESPSFLQLSRKGISHMLKCGALDRVPVLQRLDAVMRWFVEQHHPDPVNYEDIRKEIDAIAVEFEISMLSKLHFELLSLEELSEVMDKYDGLITPEENAKLMKYQRNKDASKLPDWCILEAEQ